MIVNNGIRAREVLLIGQDGEQLGIKSKREALQLAEEANLDLVLVAPKARPAVARIMDYGKYRFEMQKKEREARKKQKTITVKEIRLSPSIDTNDFNTKVKQAKGWISDGNKVRVDMRFRGRMMTRQDVGKKVMENFIESMKDVASVDKQPLLEGNTLSCTLSPIKVK